MRRSRAGRWLLVCSTLVLCSGCFDLLQEIWLEPGGGGRLRLEVCLPKSLLSMARKPDPERLCRAVGVRATEVAALVGAAVVQDALAAVRIPDRLELLRDLADGGVPVDRLVGSVGASEHARRQSVRAVLVVVHALRLLADVALRHRICLVAAHAGNVRAVRLHFEAAIDGAEDAGGLLPVTRVGFGCHGAPASSLVIGRRTLSKADPRGQRITDRALPSSAQSRRRRLSEADRTPFRKQTPTKRPHPTLEHLILDLISLHYQETLSTPSGHQAEEARAASIKENKGKFILVVDGAIPVKDNGIYCKIAGRTVLDILKDTAKECAAIIAIGSCSSWGGVPSAHPNPTGATPVHKVLADAGIKTPVINIPGCPPNPYNFLSTVLYYA